MRLSGEPDREDDIRGREKMRMLQRWALGTLIAASMLISGCAQVPKESVELSSTVGRDLGEIEKSHLKLIDTLFDRYEADANRFIDNVYAPFYIQKSLEKHGGRLVSAIEAAARPGAPTDAQKRVYGLLEVYIEEAHREIEDFRKINLTPLRVQRKELRDGVVTAYARVHKANAIVTGYLASVVKVTELQNELLASLGLPDLQDKIGEEGEKLSNDLSKLVAQGQGGTEDADKLVKKFEDLMGKLRQKKGGSQ